MPLPHDYIERVYAGVLGKIIGVYLGRPFEGWTYETIMERLGEINYYVHEQLDVPLIVTDDDISGTFTFLRALQDYGYSRDLTPQQIGQSWLNYLIEERTVLWWGGMGNSTEHTAYLRLKHGMEAPQSGAIATNGKVVAEQIGAQIFIDGWAMIAPGDPALAADFARRAGSVSHDGEAIYGAQVLAAMEAQAFVESDIDALLDTGISFIPKDSIIYRMIGDIREWHAAESDWRKTREQIAAHYGYDKYGGNCHMVPNHGLIIHSLLHGEGDFQQSLKIVNTCGWDTDCNSGNVGCLLGIRNGLAGFETGPDFRGPVADRLYLSTAEGGRGITDAVAETIQVVNAGRALRGEPPLTFKDGARFHFELPDSVQGFMAEQTVETQGTVTVENVEGHSKAGNRSLALRYRGVAAGRTARVSTPTFIPSKAVSDYFEERGYTLFASPTLYPGQTVRAAVVADETNGESVNVCLYLRAMRGPEDESEIVRSGSISLAEGEGHLFEWTVPELNGAPIAQSGVEISSRQRLEGTLYLDYLTWDGTPEVILGDPGDGSSMWRKAWINGVDIFGERWWQDAYRLIQNEGRGLLMQGTGEWDDYQVESTLTIHMAKAAGVAIRVQGLRRYYALLLYNDDKARLIKALDGDTILAEADFEWQQGGIHQFELAISGNRIQGSIDGVKLFDVTDDGRPLTGGSAAYVIEEGRIMSDAMKVGAVVM